MEALWITVGIVILAFTLLDSFLAVLNYNEAGIFVNRVVRWMWIILRSLTRRVTRRWRPMVLRQVTGILIVTTLLSWMGGLVLGFTFIYLGLIGLGHFEISDGVTPDFVGAFYLSVGQFSTAGADNITPGGGWVNLIPVAEALTSVVMLSFFITFLSNIYGVIQNLRSLCADFFQVGSGVGSPIEALRPFFPEGEPRGIDLHLTFMVNDFNTYCDSLRQDRAAYHFQSGEDQFSLPFGLYMTSGVVGSLKWGLPTGHPAAQSPAVPRLIEAFNDFRDLRYNLMKWRSPSAPTPVPREQFSRQWTEYHEHRLDADLDPWVVRFITLNDAMAEMAGASAPNDTDDPYERYVGWLAFTYPAQHFVADVSRDLDYQPMYRDVPADADLAPSKTVQDASEQGANRRRTPNRFVSWLANHPLIHDPALERLRTAGRTLAVVAVAAGAAALLATALSLDVTTAWAFAGLIAMFAAPTAPSSVRSFRRGGLIGLLPVAAGIAIGTLLPLEPIWIILGLAVTAALAVWIGRFGSLASSCGRLLFVACFFSTVLAVGTSEVFVALIAAAIGVVCAWAASFLPDTPARRRLAAGRRVFAARAAAMLDEAIDALAVGNAASVEKRLTTALVSFQDTAAYLTTLLDPDTPPRGLSAQRTERLRLQVFDVDLAASNLIRTLPRPTDYQVTVQTRSMLAGELDALQRNLRSSMRSGAPVPSPQHSEVSENWPHELRLAFDAVRDLADAFAQFDVMREPGATDIAAPVGHASAEPDSAEAHLWHSAVDPTGKAVTDRRAAQTGVSVGIALFVGGLASSSAQFWAALPAYQALAAVDGMTWSRNLSRVISTVVGAAAAFALALWTDHDPVVAFAVLAVSVFLTSFLRTVASSWTVFWQTVLLATMYDAVSSLNAEAVGVRIVETLVGSVTALVVSAILLPTRTRTRVLHRMSEAVRVGMADTHAALQRLSRPASHEDGTRAEVTAETTRQMHAIQAVARPLRGSNGALQRGGLEIQLTSLWALLYYARRLSSSAEGAHVPAIAPERLQRLDATTHVNYEAALAVLEGRLPTRVVQRVRESTSSARSNASQHEHDVLFDIERINEALLTFIDDVNPGAAGAQTTRE